MPVRVLEALMVDVNDLKKRLERSIPERSQFPPRRKPFRGRIPGNDPGAARVESDLPGSKIAEERRNLPGTPHAFTAEAHRYPGYQTIKRVRRGLRII